ncbi:MAG: cyclic-di-AMP receptor [Defluviitaleaceae bacterium]|nr:cyclic-di-AMP receptor [Defluviitaleaceae bacterium]
MIMMEKLVIAIINDEDAFQIIDLLSEEGFKVTKLASTGGFLRAGNTTLLCGAEADRLNELVSIIEKKCRSRKQITSVNSAHLSTAENYVPYPVEVTVGGATIFVLNLADFKRF